MTLLLFYQALKHGLKD